MIHAKTQIKPNPFEQRQRLSSQSVVITSILNQTSKPLVTIIIFLVKTFLRRDLRDESELFVGHRK